MLASGLLWAARDPVAGLRRPCMGNTSTHTSVACVPTPSNRGFNDGREEEEGGNSGWRGGRMYTE